MCIRRLITWPRLGPLARLARPIAAVFLSLWLSGCGGLVSVVTATPESPAQGSVTQVALSTGTGYTSRPSRTPRATRTPETSITPAGTPDSAHSAGATALPSAIDGLRVVTPTDLPPEAQHTLDTIDQGGPFPYRQDGAVFQNREGILPHKPSGYYHEYTVITPGAPDRGARRIIAGSQGEVYYTDDHYVTFVRVIRP